MLELIGFFIMLAVLLSLIYMHVERSTEIPDDVRQSIHRANRAIIDSNERRFGSKREFK